MGWRRDKYKSEHSGSDQSGSRGNYDGGKPKTRCGHTGKVSFKTEEGALNRGGQIWDEGGNRRFTPNQWRAYRCQYCNSFHLTSQ